jgi:hypothetical protein
MIAVPRVSVSSSDLIADQAPGRHRNTRRWRPPPEGRISSRSPLRSDSFWTTAPEFLVDVDDDFLDRLEPLAGFFVRLEDDRGPRHRQLEALAAHGLDQDAKLQLAAARQRRTHPCRRFR